MDIHPLGLTSRNSGTPDDQPLATRSRTWLRWVERVLVTVGILALGYSGYVQAEAFLYQRFETQELDRILHSRVDPDESTVSISAPHEAPEPGSPVGKIDIPRLGVSAVVLAGTDARTLRHAVGHIQGTALPGAEGNVGLAAHRDTFFRRLRDVERGDIIAVSTVDGVFRYVVEGTRVVMPADVWVLDPTGHESMTLVTCYPFTYVGPAPKRFIVQASLIR